MSYWNRAPVDFDELRRRANANLVANRNRPIPEPKSRVPELKAATRYELELGERIMELRELRKPGQLWAQLMKKSAKGLSTEENGMLEELDHRVETLQEELDGMTDAETRRLVRIHNKALKRRI